MRFSKLAAAGLLSIAVHALGADLAADFRSPPEAARPHSWWHWMDGNASKEGITADLEAMHRIGIGGVEIFDVGYQIPEGPVKYASPEWRDLFNFATQEAQRLGMEVGMHNCSGWSSTGGPWVTPDMGMKTLVITELPVKGGTRITASLPTPLLKGNPAFQTDLTKYAEYYHDIAVIAFKGGAGDYRLPGWQQKAAFTDLRNASWETTAPDSAIIHQADILDITAHVANGTLNWDAPAGDWTILRVGYAPNGRNNKPPTTAGKGLEIDKLDPAAVDLHFHKFLDLVLKDVGPRVGKTLTTIVIDSYETGTQNWTPGFRDEFKKRRGYDMLPYLPAFTGRIVESADVTERFLFDVRTTVAELFHDNYYQHFRDETRKRGLLTGIEPYDGPFDTLNVGTLADRPMSEFWNRKPNDSSRGRYVVSAANLSGHQVIGAEAFTSQFNEDKYTTDPYSLKAIGDWQFCDGINQMIFHRFAHQPWVDTRGPGMTMGPWGFHMDRSNTWWDQSRDWITYLTRCQYLLQAGRSTSDILCFSGEQQHIHSRWNNSETPPIPAGYDYEFASTALLAQAKVDNGVIAMPGGLSFKALLLPDSRAMTPAALAAIDRLVAAGATLVGPPPTHSLSLEGYPAADAAFKTSIDHLWGGIDGQTATDHSYGKGRVYWGKPIADILASIDPTPDFAARGDDAGSIRFKHRVLPEGDVYFVSNQLPRDTALLCSFRIDGKRPELFHPDTGMVEPAPIYTVHNGVTELPLRFDPAGSLFVVFRQPDRGDDHLVNLSTNAPGNDGINLQTQSTLQDGRFLLHTSLPGTYQATTSSRKNLLATVAPLPQPLTIDGAWTIDFQPKRGAPPSATLDRLASWSDNPDDGIKYFSGTAVYHKQIDVPAALLANGNDLYLDLGSVKNIAEVKINGSPAQILWKPPFRMLATSLLHPGANQLEIHVTNLWVNRLIGDENLPDDVEWAPAERNRGQALKAWPEWLLKNQPRPSGRIAFSTWKFYSKGDPLLPSGLLGPVTLQPVANVELK
jgi:hypothetical protein